MRTFKKSNIRLNTHILNEGFIINKSDLQHHNLLSLAITEFGRLSFIFIVKNGNIW